MNFKVSGEPAASDLFLTCFPDFQKTLLLTYFSPILCFRGFVAGSPLHNFLRSGEWPEGLRVRMKGKRDSQSSHSPSKSREDRLFGRDIAWDIQSPWRKNPPNLEKVQERKSSPKRKFSGRISRGRPDVIRVDVPGQNFGQALEPLKNKHLGADVHDPNAWTSMSPGGAKKLGRKNSG